MSKSNTPQPDAMTEELREQVSILLKKAYVEVDGDIFGLSNTMVKEGTEAFLALFTKTLQQRLERVEAEWPKKYEAYVGFADWQESYNNAVNNCWATLSSGFPEVGGEKT